MTDEPKRRHYLVKPWFQARYLLLLVMGLVMGSIVFAMVLQVILRQRMNLMLASGDTVFRGEEIWFTLYPIVVIFTLTLILAGILLLFLFFRVFVKYTAHASLRLENYYRALLRAEPDTTVDKYRGILEFQALAQRTAALVLGYQRKWTAIADKAGELRTAAGGLANEDDPYRRIHALRECEKRAVSLGESCTPRRLRVK